MKEVFVVQEQICGAWWDTIMVCDQLSVAQMEIENLWGDLARPVRLSDYHWQLVSTTQTDRDGEPELMASYVISPKKLVTFRDPYKKFANANNEGEQQ